MFSIYIVYYLLEIVKLANPRIRRRARAGRAAAERVTSLPRGTVTFGDADIAGSAELLKRLGDRYAEALADHRSIVREEFQGARRPGDRYAGRLRTTASHARETRSRRR